MDPCARQVCYLLQFLSASAEEQIAFTGSLLPVSAGELSDAAAADDNARYELYWTEQQGHPLTLLLRQLELYFPMFFNLDENTLPPEETILQELTALLNLMVFSQGNTGTYNRFWDSNSLRQATEWKLMRRLSQTALTKLGWPAGLPETTFAGVLHG